MVREEDTLVAHLPSSKGRMNWVSDTTSQRRRTTSVCACPNHERAASGTGDDHERLDVPNHSGRRCVAMYVWRRRARPT
jgi:hypothetical protein